MTYALANSGAAHVAGHSTDSNGFTTGNMDSTGGDLLIAGLSDSADGTTVTDSKSNTLTKLTPHSFGNSCVLRYAKNATVGSGHNGIAAGTSVFPSLYLAAFSGSDLTSPFDQQNGSQTAGATSLATGSITPSVDNCLVVALLAVDSATGSITIDSGFTLLDSVLSGGNFGYVGGALAYKIQTTAAAVNPTWSWTSGGNAEAMIASFKAAAAAKSFIVPDRQPRVFARRRFI